MARNIKKNIMNRFPKNSRLGKQEIIMSRDHFQKMELQHDAAAAKKSDGMLNQFKVYFSLRAFSVANYGDRRIEMIPVDDALQEISTALIELGGEEKDGVVSVEWSRKNFRHARNAVRRLCSAYGFGDRHRKEKSIFEKIGEDLELIDVLPANEKSEPIAVVEMILSMYESGSTVKEICENLGVPFTHSKQTAMNRLFPRNIGHGGKRKNSGRKKIT